MSKFGQILRIAEDGGVMFWCPGCDEAHFIRVGTGNGPRWGFNENQNAPTFTPSILVTSSQKLTDEQWDFIDGGGRIEPIRTVCHSFVRDGLIEFLSDCTHSLAGKTVPLPIFDDEAS